MPTPRPGCTRDEILNTDLAQLHSLVPVLHFRNHQIATLLPATMYYIQSLVNHIRISAGLPEPYPDCHIVISDICPQNSLGYFFFRHRAHRPTPPAAIHVSQPSTYRTQDLIGRLVTDAYNEDTPRTPSSAPTVVTNGQFPEVDAAINTLLQEPVQLTLDDLAGILDDANTDAGMAPVQLDTINEDDLDRFLSFLESYRPSESP